MFLMIENEVKDDHQFKECIKKIHKKKAMLLESVNFMKALESQWLCLGAFYSYDGAAQCNCDACNNFAIRGNENISQKLEAAETKVEEKQTDWKPHHHLDELVDLLRSYISQKCITEETSNFIPVGFKRRKLGQAQKYELDKPKPTDDLVSKITLYF